MVDCIKTTSKKHKSSVYRALLHSGRLYTYLAEIDAHAKEMFENLTRNMAQLQSVTDELKARDQMAWVGVMNNIRQCAEENVLREIIYA